MAQSAADGTKSSPTPKAKPVTLPDFLRICGLDLSDGESFRTFEKIKEECALGGDRLLHVVQGRSASNQPMPGTATEPYSRIDEAEMRATILQIYDLASPQTRLIYDRGGVAEGNWVIRWMLWQNLTRHRN